MPPTPVGIMDNVLGCTIEEWENVTDTVIWGAEENNWYSPNYDAQRSKMKGKIALIERGHQEFIS